MFGGTSAFTPAFSPGEREKHSPLLWKKPQLDWQNSLA